MIGSIYFALAVFAASVLANLFIIIFGKADVDALKSRVPLRKWVRELDADMARTIGSGGTVAVKLAACSLVVLFLAFHLVTAILSLLAAGIGILASRRVYAFPPANAFLNRMAVYVNKLRR